MLSVLQAALFFCFFLTENMKVHHGKLAVFPVMLVLYIYKVTKLACSFASPWNPRICYVFTIAQRTSVRNGHSCCPIKKHLDCHCFVIG